MSGFTDAYFNRARSVICEAEERNCKFQLLDTDQGLRLTGAGPALEMFQTFLQIDFRTRNSSRFMVYAPTELAGDLQKLGGKINDNVYVVERKHLLAMCEKELRRSVTHLGREFRYELDFGSMPWRVRAIPKGAPEDISLFETSPLKLSVPPLSQTPRYELTDKIEGSWDEMAKHLKNIDRAIEKCKKMYGSAPAFLTLLTPGLTMQGSRLDRDYR